MTPVEHIGIVITGSVKIIRDDIDENRTILAECYESDIFAESLACAEVLNRPISAIATEKT